MTVVGVFVVVLIGALVAVARVVEASRARARACTHTSSSARADAVVAVAVAVGRANSSRRGTVGTAQQAASEEVQAGAQTGAQAELAQPRPERK